ncbi:hypothetical protein DSO57_1017098 [Entomophthora muscae]|uniref:Uncharacterized protein n=1 Tax=Entomophthora muscae TaxID=34485 RepID=A0ACC2TFZ3_9FUNG|nr:hypothetical protein DSO57_1017098 [Entomophthora muscae]
MELRLSDTQDEFQCNVSLQLKYDNKGYALPSPKEISFKEGLADLYEIEITVRRAQKAILNPKKPHQDYLNHKFDDSTPEAKLKDASSNELTFTENTILIKIQGAKTNLTLIDLPGIIRSTENDKDAHSIALVENLVKTQIQNPKALIIAAISCKDEIENQAILSLAKQVDPKGQRTIGVLTKPHTIEANCHSTWFQVLNNRRFTLKLGYYIIKNPTKQDLLANVSFHDARRNEKTFFEKNSPWNTCPVESKLRMGVDNLREALSDNLTQLIEKSIPQMKSKVIELLESASQELISIPPEVSQSPKLELLNRIRDFSYTTKSLLMA